MLGFYQDARYETATETEGPRRRSRCDAFQDVRPKVPQDVRPKVPRDVRPKMPQYSVANNSEATYTTSGLGPRSAVKEDNVSMDSGSRGSPSPPMYHVLAPNYNHQQRVRALEYASLQMLDPDQRKEVYQHYIDGIKHAARNAHSGAGRIRENSFAGARPKEQRHTYSLDRPFGKMNRDWPTWLTEPSGLSYEQALQRIDEWRKEEDQGSHRPREERSPNRQRRPRSPSKGHAEGGRQDMGFDPDVRPKDPKPTLPTESISLEAVANMKIECELGSTMKASK